VTNRHVIEDGIRFKVEREGKTWPAKLISVDADLDLAELSVPGLNAPAVRIRASSTLAVGEKVYAIGAPEGLELTISEGLISGLRDFDKERVIQTSAAISHGSSGGGLFDGEGRLVGITTFYLKEGQSLNFAVPADGLMSLELQPANAATGLPQNTVFFQALVWCELGFKAFEAGKYEQAISAFQVAVRVRPDGESAWYDLGGAYLTVGMYREAVAAEQEAIRLKPNDEQAWCDLGMGYQNLEEYDKALFAGEEAVRLRPDDERSRCVLGEAYVGLGQYNKALAAFQEAVRLRPEYEGGWYGLGVTYERLGSYGQAMQAEREAIRLKPEYAWAWYELGWLYNQQGQRSEVTKIYETLKSLDPKVADQFFRSVILPSEPAKESQ
jgi:tetratricopeptide (TPR) repeat protein